MIKKDWHKGALCAQTDPEIFFNDKCVDRSPLAKRICGNCPVSEQCLQESLDNFEEFGVWGGTTGKERLTMLRGIHGAEFQWPSLENGTASFVADWDNPTVCKRGHDLTLPGMISTTTSGTRRCTQCKRDSGAALPWS